MALHMTLADHDADPPSAWQVVKVAERCWHLDSSLGGTIGTYTTRKAAESGKEDGPQVTLWEKEGRWMRGEAIPGWRPYDAVRAEREAAAAFTWNWLRERWARGVPAPGAVRDARLAAVACLAATLNLALPPAENVSAGRCHACGYPVSAHHGVTAEGSDAAGALTVTLHRGCLAQVRHAQETRKPTGALQEDRHLA